MEHVLLRLCLFTMAATFCQATAWSGNYYHARTSVYYTSRSICTGHFLWWCIHYETVYDPHYTYVYDCCPGWKQSGVRQCTTPVCNPSCHNGGTCQAPSGATCRKGTHYCYCTPNVCDCPFEHPGLDCGGSQCSHLSPCYPGQCLGGDGCSCSTGFTTTGGKSDYCLSIDYRQEAELKINQMQVRMSYWPREAQSQSAKFWMVTDSTNLEENEMDFMWTNQRDFNRLETTCSSQFFLDSLPPKPAYIGDTAVGVAKGEMEIWLSKINPQGGRFDSIKNTTLKCPQTVSLSQPEQGFYNCNIVNGNFDRILEHGDFLRVTYRTRAGGYRKLLDLNFNPARDYKTQYFTGDDKTLSVEFRFDFNKPVHCMETSSCSRPTNLLSVPDISTSAPVSISWEGWSDADSGMYVYTMEVMKMTQTFTGHLQIQRDDFLHPVEKREIFEVNLTSQSYTPPSPGLYSVVLGAADVANNTKYARRLLLYDPHSTITLDPSHPLHVSTASSAANYTYQSDVSSDVVVTWTGYFRNAFLEENGLLGEVQTFPIFQENLDKRIERSSVLEDHDGTRTVDRIPNVEGMVNFEVAWDKDFNGGLNQHLTPPSNIGWTNLDLSTNYTLLELPKNGITFTIWVKARDAIGRERVERTQVHFDTTPPIVQEFKFVMNSPAEHVDFASKFQLTATDGESGVAYVHWRFERENGSVLYEEFVPGRSETYQICSTHFTTCGCTPARECFPFDQSYVFSNCHAMVEKERLEDETVTVTAVVTNMAGLTTTRVHTILDLTALNGTHAYFPPQNITVTTITDNSVTLTWTFPPSCFRREELWVEVEGERRSVHKNAEQFDLTGLSPEKSYTVYMRTGYEGGEMSDRVPVSFTTAAAPASGLSAGVFAGAGVGIIIVFICVSFIVVFVLWRKGYVLQQPGRIHKQLTRVNSIYSNFTNLRGGGGGIKRRERPATKVQFRISSAGFQNKTYEIENTENNDADELYVYGDMTFESRQAWELTQNSLTLVEHLTKGKFANIYKAYWKTGTDETVVVAKMLKPAYTEEDSLKMTAKIHFMATRLQEHTNVLTFLGACMDNKNWGPVMVLEYCEKGQLDKWLVRHRADVSTKILESMHHFALGVASGMAYLASKQIVHRRLAARNILLTKNLEVKLAGFGPQDKEAEEMKHARVPAKWAALEVLQNQPPTEKSDVWSFGVVLWEIFSMGQVPYANIHSKEIGAQLKGGYRMDKPEFSDHMVYELMQQCWREDPAQRPTFNSLRSHLGRMFGTNRNSADVDYYTMEHVAP